MRTLIKQEARLWLTNQRTKMLLAGVLVIIIISTLWLVEKKEDKPPFASIGICNKDTSNYANLMLSYLKDNKELGDYVKFTLGNEGELLEQFQKGDLSLFGIVPEGFAENMIQIQNTPIQIYLNTTDQTKAVILKNMLAAYSDCISAVEAGCVSLYEVMQRKGMDQYIIDKENVKISYDLVFLVLSKNDLFKHQEVKQMSAVSLKSYYFYAGLLLLISYLSLLPGMRLLLEISQKRIHRLILCNLSCTVILLSRVFSLSLVFVIIAACLAIRLNVVSCLLLFSYALFSTMFFLLLSLFVKRRTAYLLGSNCFILLTGLLCGQIIPLSYLPERIVHVASIFLPYHTLKQLLIISVGQNNGAWILLLVEWIAIVLTIVAASIKMKDSLEVMVDAL